MEKFVNKWGETTPSKPTKPSNNKLWPGMKGGGEARHPSLDISFMKYLKYDSISERNRILEDIFFKKKYILYKNK